MSKKKIAINGFGRIGRLTFRNLLENDNLEVVAINDLTDNGMLAHLLKYDTAQGKFDGEVTHTDDTITVNGHTMQATAIRNPEELPWKELGIDIVLECTGIFRTKEQASMHLTAGAKKVIISAPAKSDDVRTIVLGINEDSLKDTDVILSNASCTTNCLAPVLDTVIKNWGWEYGNMTTTHAYTGAQRLQDAPHKDWRRGRAAAQNIVPTTTGSAKAVAKVLPIVKGKFDAIAVRVPVITGSLVDLTIITEKKVTVEEINAAFKARANGDLKGILAYTEDPIVSSDIIGDKHSAIFDALMTKVHGDNIVKIIAWYDNEAGYSARLADLAGKI